VFQNSGCLAAWAKMGDIRRLGATRDPRSGYRHICTGKTDNRNLVTRGGGRPRSCGAGDGADGSPEPSDSCPKPAGRRDFRKVIFGIGLFPGRWVQWNPMTLDIGGSSQGQSMSAQERKIRELLSQARWRKARDEAKPLVKLDRARYLPLLVEANLGLAREMLAKGQKSEAAQVVAYLKTIASKEVVETLAAEIAMASNDFSAVASHSLQVLTQSAPTISETERCRLADQVIVAFEPKPPGNGAEILLLEAEAIHRALRYISEERFDLAADILRPIGTHSMFRHWKLFLKGLIAFHQGEAEKAQRLLAGLPPDSAVARAAVPYLYWMDSKDKRLKEAPDDVLHVVARFCGIEQSASTVVRAEQLWWEGKPAEMYSLLRKGIEDFPSDRPDRSGALSEFCLNCLSILPWETAEPYVAFLEDLDRRTKSDTEKKMLLRMLSLNFAGSDPFFLLGEWDRYLKLRDRMDGPNDRLSSIGYEWLGSILLGLDGKDVKNPELQSGPIRDSRTVKAALDALEKSARLDPGNINAHLLLANLYDRLKRHKDRNRLLDQMTVRFPQNKNVLLLAGNRCIDRKAYVKGLAYLTQAMEHDRLDPAIPECIVIARTLYAFDQYRRGRAEEARNTLDAAESLAVERQDDFIRGRWSMLLRRGILEHSYGDPESVERLLDIARTASPGEEAFYYFGHTLSRRYGRTPAGMEWFADNFRAGLGSASVCRAVVLLRIYDFWSRREGAPPLNVARSLLREYLRAAGKRPFSREEARELIERIPLTSPFEAERKPIIKAMLKKDRKDPLFRLFEYCDINWGFQSVESRKRKLDEIMREAQSRKDDAAVQSIRRELQNLDSLVPQQFSGYRDDEESEDEYEFEDDLGIEEMLGTMMESMSPREREAFGEFAAMLSNASEKELRQIKKMKPRGMPQVIFDLFVEEIRARGARGPHSDMRPRSSRSKKRSQGNLF
jgi:tetratricopeptide (TPR) repeat protein